MAVIANKCPDINVYVVDINIKKIELWNSSDYNQSSFLIFKFR